MTFAGSDSITSIAISCIEPLRNFLNVRKRGSIFMKGLVLLRGCDIYLVGAPCIN